jgi:GNAT superfamily N-acetyltransferase
MPLVVAEDAILDEIIDATFPLWHDGLPRDAYARLNAAQMRTSWGGRHLHRVALVDDRGRLLASAKRYRLHATLGGRATRVCGIGAVFTPVERRGRGYASELVERLVADERDQGAEVALLFSAIEPSFYERLQFQPVPLDEVTLTVARKDGAPAMLVRAGTESDLPALAAMHQVRSSPSRFALVRDPAFIGYVLARKRMRAGLGPAGVRYVEFHVAEEGASAVAYVVLSIGELGWTLDEAGDRDPAGARLGALLQVLLAREPSVRPPVIRAWWPRAFALPPQMAIAARHAAMDVMMMRALGAVPVPSRAEDVFYWRGDVF